MIVFFTGIKERIFSLFIDIKKKKSIGREKKRKTKGKSSYQYCEYPFRIYLSIPLTLSPSQEYIYIHGWNLCYLHTFQGRELLMRGGEGIENKILVRQDGIGKVCGRLQCRGNSYNLGANHPSDSWRCSSPISCFHYDPPQLWVLIEPSPVPYPIPPSPPPPLPPPPFPRHEFSRGAGGGGWIQIKTFRLRDSKADFSSSVISKDDARRQWISTAKFRRDSIKRLIKSGICSTFNAQARIDQLYVNPGRKSGQVPRRPRYFPSPVPSRPSLLPPFAPPPWIFYPLRREFRRETSAIIIGGWSTAVEKFSRHAANFIADPTLASST